MLDKTAEIKVTVEYKGNKYGAVYYDTDDLDPWDIGDAVNETVTGLIRSMPLQKED